MNIPLGKVVLDAERLRWVYVGARTVKHGKPRHRFVCAYGQKNRGWDFEAVMDTTLIKKFPELAGLISPSQPSVSSAD